MALTRDMIAEVVATSDRQRFAIDVTGQRIRANQGHSIAVELGTGPRSPPGRAFFTARTGNRWRRSEAEGLNAGRRQHVRVSADEETAVKVGR